MLLPDDVFSLHAVSNRGNLARLKARPTYGYRRITAILTCWNGDITRGASIIDAHDREPRCVCRYSRIRLMITLNRDMLKPYTLPTPVSGVAQ